MQLGYLAIKCCIVSPISILDKCIFCLLATTIFSKELFLIDCFAFCISFVHSSKFCSCIGRFLIQSFMFHTGSYITPYLNIKERIEEAEEEERLH